MIWIEIDEEVTERINFDVTGELAEWIQDMKRRGFFVTTPEVVRLALTFLQYHYGQRLGVTMERGRRKAKVTSCPLSWHAWCPHPFALHEVHDRLVGIAIRCNVDGFVAYTAVVVYLVVILTLGVAVTRTRGHTWP